MARGFRILHTADSHIGVDLPARPRSTRPRRGDDVIASYRRVLSLAEAEDVDLVIHSGDVFDLPRPNDSAIAAAAGPLFDLARVGIPTVIVPGNHERSALPESLLFAHRNIHVVREPCTLRFSLRGTQVAIAALPCIRRGAASGFAKALRESRWSAARADVNLLAVHQTFESAVCGPVGYRFRTGDDVVERDAVPRAFAYVAAGHIHRHQVLETGHPGGGPIVYAGSPERISLAERGEPKGAVLIEHACGRLTHRFIEHEVRPMLVVPMDVSGRSRREILREAHRLVAELPPRAVAVLRLSGETTRPCMRGLRLTRWAADERPDVMLRVASRTVEFVPQRVVERRNARARQFPGRGVFAELGPGAGRVVFQSADERRLLPAACGTYALLDGAGRPLYVGKSRNIRTRVRAHLASRSGGAFFSRWMGDVCRIEARLAYCELEALLVEAEMIRRLRPPFNRQMRLWSRYCYLCEGSEPFGQLVACPDPADDRPCYGPFRSRSAAQRIGELSAAAFGLAHCPAPSNGNGRPLAERGLVGLCDRYFAGECTGPCARRIDEAEYRTRLVRRDSLLRGENDPAEALAPPGDDVARLPETLRDAFAQARLLRRAETLRGGVLILPGGEATRTITLFAADGLHLSELIGDVAHAAQLLDERRRLAAGVGRKSHGRLSKSVVDCYRIAARELRRGVESVSLIPARVADRLDARGLLAVAGLWTTSRSGGVRRGCRQGV